LKKNISGKKVFVLFLLYLLFALVIFPSLPGSKAGILDIKYYYTAQQAYEIISNYSPQERLYYSVSALTIDILYPIIYSLFLSSLLILIFRKLSISIMGIYRLCYFPFAAAFFDLLENASVVILMLNYPVKFYKLAHIAGYFTAAKWSLVIISLLSVLAFSILLGIKKLKDDSKRYS